MSSRLQRSAGSPTKQRELKIADVGVAIGAGTDVAVEAIVLSPAIGAVLMSLSTIIVALNPQLLRRTTL